MAKDQEDAMTIEELVEHVGIKSEDLDKEFSEEHLAKFAKSIANWEQFAKPLGLSDQDITNIKRDPNPDQGMKTVRMLEKWRKKYAFKATYKIMVTIILKQDDAVLAQEVCSLVKDGLDEEKVSTKCEASSSYDGGTQDVLLERLRIVLQPMRGFSDTDGKTAAIVQEFVITSIKSDYNCDDIQSVLQSFHKQQLFSDEVLQEANALVEKEYAQHVARKGVGAQHSKPHPKKPLFSKDTVYHADILCRVLAEGDTGNYQSLFKKLPNGQGHSFTAVSMSQSKTERLLIAEQGESVIYFAFESRPQLSDWKDYNSFDKGVTMQSQQFPVRYIVELLNKQHCIILTGFSFGGLLANSVTATVWSLPFISTELLKENLVCITFGKPLVNIELAHSVAQRRPEISSTIHSIHMEGDPVPALMSFLDVSWSVQELSVAESGSPSPAMAGTFTPLKDSSTSSLLDAFHEVHSTSTNIENSLIRLKTKLKKLQPKLPQLPEPPESIYQMVRNPKAGLVFEDSNIRAMEHFIKTLLIENIEERSIKMQHSTEYSEALFDSHLDKEPRYPIPPAPKHAPQELKNLLPSIDEVHVHHHGDQTAIAIQGSNLWFCQEVSLLGLRQDIVPSITSSSSIRVNVPKDELQLGAHDASDTTQIPLSIHTSFSSKSIKQDFVPLFIKGFGVTIRQKQLAKLSPSKVIELAYLSALLEQSPNGEGNSHKFEVIATFLRNVVKVVPFESITYAIAYSSYETALTCTKALLDSKIEPPPTHIMHRGTTLAGQRMEHGVPPQVVIEHGYSARQVNRPLSILEEIHKDSNSDIVIHSTVHSNDAVTPPYHTTTIPSCKLLSNYSPEVGHELQKICEQIVIKIKAEGKDVVYVSDLTIDILYPLTRTESNVLRSPIDILVDGRTKFSQLASSAVGSVTQHIQTKDNNKQMLLLLNNIRQTDLEVCTSLLGGFMEQQNVDIALVKSPKNSFEALELIAVASVGVWVLFNLDYDHIKATLSQCDGEKLLVKISDYIKNNMASIDDNEDSSYAAKLQFITSGMAKTVTCNTQYISYSLERQLVDLCKERKIDASVSLSDLQNKWGTFFKEKTLSLVDRFARPLIGRWLKWALMVHNLREELAKYTAIGVTGLVNSGKSKLINTLFGIQIPVGTTEESRTTVPFLYNLDRSVEGLNVVDFPGVDDEDDTIGDLADLLITVAQIILFVVDYRKAHTQSAKKWLERLHKEKVPVLVCLTFGDKLYAEHYKKGVPPHKETMTTIVKDQLSVTEEKLQSTGSHKVAFFSFAQDNDSVLNSEEGRGKLRDVGIGSPLQVGEWLVQVFRRDFDNERLADQLEPFMSKNYSNMY